MKSLETLLQELCSDGVEFVKLGDCCTFKRGTTITAKNAIPGNVPVLAGGQKPAYYHNEANRTGETIVIAGSGAYAGFVSYWTIPVFLSDSFSVEPDERLVIKFVYYFLKNIQQKIFATKKGSGVPHVHGSSIAKFEIPCPPLEVQNEIVRILDNFTQLEAELEAELDCRKRQYEYYRDQLLNFNKITPPNNIIYKKLSEVGTFIRGNGLQKKDFTPTGVGCIHYGQIYTHYKTSAKETITYCSEELAKKLKKADYGDIVIATTSENVEDVCKAVAWLGKESIAISGDAYIFKHDQNPKYIAYIFQTAMFFDYKKRKANGTKVIRLSGDAIGKFEIPIPPLEEQNRIVAILDRFEALTTSLQDGLPAEIAARRQQYEYYRDKLLDFKRKAI